jgi:hypothetical protein
VAIEIVYKDAIVSTLLLINELRNAVARIKAVIIKNNHSSKRHSRPDPIKDVPG